jgi:hypothetical protein
VKTSTIVRTIRASIARAELARRTFAESNERCARAVEAWLACADRAWDLAEDGAPRAELRSALVALENAQSNAAHVLCVARTVSEIECARLEAALATAA